MATGPVNGRVELLVLPCLIQIDATKQADAWGDSRVEETKIDHAAMTRTAQYLYHPARGSGVECLTFRRCSLECSLDRLPCGSGPRGMSRLQLGISSFRTVGRSALIPLPDIERAGLDVRY